MPLLTALVLAGFVGYGAAWYMGNIEGNFALVLFLATVVTGLYWVAERLVFLPRRRAAAQALQAQSDQRRSDLAAQGISQVDGDVAVVGRGVARVRSALHPEGRASCARSSCWSPRGRPSS